MYCNTWRWHYCGMWSLMTHALANDTQGMVSRTVCQLCAASRILKPNSLVDISHPCHPDDHITYLSMFTAEGENTEFIRWQNPAVTHSLCAHCLLETLWKRSRLCQATVLRYPLKSRQVFFRQWRCMNGTFKGPKLRAQNLFFWSFPLGQRYEIPTRQ